jgi:hypothetical protein
VTLLPKILAAEARTKVIQLWIQGTTIESIAEAAAISASSVRNVIKEARSGKFPEYAQFVNVLDDLRWASQQLKTNARTMEQVNVGWAVFSAIDELKADPAEIRDALNALLKLASPDFPTQSFARAALALLKIEQDSGRSLQELTKEAAELPTTVEELRKEVKSLTETKNSLDTELTNLQREREHMLTKNQLTQAALEQITDLRGRLTEFGINFDDMERLETIVKHAREAKFDPAILIAKLQTIGNMEVEIGKLREVLRNINNEAAKQSRDLENWRQLVRDAQASWGRLQSENAQLRTRYGYFAALVTNLQGRVDLCEAFFKLLTDTSAVTDEQLERFCHQVLLIMSSRKLAQNLPIDYSQLRGESIILVQSALGKRLVPKEVVEEEMRALREQNTDLMLDKLGKIEQETIKLKLRESVLESKEKEFKQATLEKTLVLSNRTGGEVHSIACNQCGSTFAYQMGPKAMPRVLLRCPFCSPGVLRRAPIPMQPQQKALNNPRKRPHMPHKTWFEQLGDISFGEKRPQFNHLIPDLF